MKRLKHTLRLLAHYRSTGLETGAAEQIALREKVRLPHTLVEQLTGGDLRREPNRLLDTLAAAVKNRELVLYLYNMEDRLLKADLNKKNHRGKHRTRSYSQRFSLMQKKLPARALLMRETLREEVRLRGLPDDLELDLTHCHLFRSIFPLTAENIKLLQDATEEEFQQMLLEYGRTLAAASRLWQSRNRFDWRAFSGAGCSEEDFADTADPRLHYLKVLDLPADATFEEIKARYKKLARTRHPDTGGSITEMQLLNEAYCCLREDR